MGTGLLLLALACHRAPTAGEAPTLRYPHATRGRVVDDDFGTKVADPYRWLEDTTAPKTRAWVDAENALTRRWLDAIPLRAAIRSRLEALSDYPRFSVPIRRGGRTFFLKNDGLQNQDVLWVSDGPEGPARVLVDPNQRSADGAVALVGLSPSDDGHFLAYGLSESGSDWSTWRIRDVATGQDLADTLPYLHSSGPTWTHDGRGFYYSRYLAPTDASQPIASGDALYFHALGDRADALIYRRADHPGWSYASLVTADGDFLLVAIVEGSQQKNRIYLKDLRDPTAPMVPLLNAGDARYAPLGEADGRFLFWTNHGAPRGQVIAFTLENPAPEAWTIVIPEGPDALVGARWVGDRILTTTLRDAHSQVQIYSLDGHLQDELALPGTGTVGGLSGEPGDADAFYSFSSFTQPDAAYRLDLATGSATPWPAPTPALDDRAYQTDQVFYPSKDGTLIPMFLVHRRDLVLDGRNPTWLTGYGGFGVCLTPTFSESTRAWLEMGGIYASANLRGGGEYGEAWHEAGSRANKQNSFDDFIAAAEWLIAQGYTSKDRLAIAGRSNGGLLVGAALTQRPDLFGAALPGAGVLDMLRYARFTVGPAWTAEYGSAADPAMFPVLLRYSPLHNVRPGTRYPATLISTGDRDDRVVPAHSYKFTAALQAAQAGPAPILLRVETGAGHGATTPTAKKRDLAADQLAFVVRALGMESELGATGPAAWTAPPASAPPPPPR